MNIKHLLEKLPSHGVCWVAYSGGADSTALLHMMSLQRQYIPAGLKAVHVDHQLHPLSHLWVKHCQKQCESLQIELQVIKVDATPPAGESPEAYARKLRYQSICRLLRDNDVLVTAHHMEDQAETLLLQLLRGAGPEGLAGMPEIRRMHPGWLVRPLLGLSKNQMRDYNLEHKLEWIEDDSNRQTGIDRNYLRHVVFPSLLSRWPGTLETLTRSASHLSEAMLILREVAEADAVKAICNTDSKIMSIPTLQELSVPRQKNLLRYWIKHNEFSMPGSHIIDNIMSDVITSRQDAQPCLQWGETEIRRFHDHLYIMNKLPAFDKNLSMEWDINQSLELPHGRLMAVKQAGAGISDNKLLGKVILVSFRQGGESIRLPGQEHTQELKKLFQQAGIPPWQRDRLPLIYVEGKLAAVANYWIDHYFKAGSDEYGREISFGFF